MTFPTKEDTSKIRTRVRTLDRGMRSPGWLIAIVISGGIVLGVSPLAFDLTQAEEAGALAVSVFFSLSGFIAFNFSPGIARISVFALWACFGGGLLGGNHSDQMIGWVILGVAALAGTEFLSRAVTSIRSTAVSDPLTGLLNRIGLINESERAINLCRRLGQPVSLVHIDLDGFKAVNDREGHAEGDRILWQCADAWAGMVRESDILARIGGDEFLLVLPGSDSDDARQLVGKLRTGSPIKWSSGVAELAPGEELQACVDRADAELYADKKEEFRTTTV